MKIKRIAYADKVRQMCIDNNYYTRGDVDAYTKMLDFVYHHLDANNEVQMIEVAQNIFNHSDINQKMLEYGCSEREVLSSIIYNLYNDCTRTFVEWEEGEK